MCGVDVIRVALTGPSMMTGMQIVLPTLIVRYYASFLRTNFIRKLLHYAAFQLLLSETHQVLIIWL